MGNKKKKGRGKGTKTRTKTEKTSSQQRDSTPDNKKHGGAVGDPSSPDSAEKIKGSASEESIDLTDPDFLHFLLVRELELFEEKMTKKVDHLTQARKTAADMDDDDDDWGNGVGKDNGVPWESYTEVDDDCNDGKEETPNRKSRDDGHEELDITTKNVEGTTGTSMDKGDEGVGHDAVTMTDSRIEGAESSQEPGRGGSCSNRKGIRTREGVKETGVKIKVKKAIGSGVGKKDKIKALLQFPQIENGLRSLAASTTSIARQVMNDTISSSGWLDLPKIIPFHELI